MNYSWLKDRQQQARAEKMAAQRPLYRPSIKERFSMYTGAGEDGVVQPTMPTHIIQTNKGPRTLDEGEILNTGPGGQFQVIPANQVGGQGKMLDIAGRAGMKRYYTGKEFENIGSISQAMTDAIAGKDPRDISVAGATRTVDPVIGSGSANTLAFPKTGSTPTFNPLQPSGSNQAVSFQPNFAKQPDNTIGFGTANPPSIGPVIGPDINAASLDTNPNKPSGSANPMSIGPVIGPDINAATLDTNPNKVTNLASGLTQKQIEDQFGNPNDPDYNNANYRAPAGSSYVPPSQPTAQPTAQPTTQPGVQPTTSAMTALRRQALLGSYATQLAGSKASEDIAGRQAVERAVLNQRTAMGNAPEGSIAAQQARLRADHAGELAGVETQYGIAGAQAQEAAQRALPGEERTQESHDFSMLQNKSQQAYDEFMRAAETGDDATVAAAYEKYYGRPITDGAMVNDIRNYARGTKAQALESGELSIQAQKVGLTSDQFEKANALIGAGYDLAAVNAATGLNLTPQQFEGVRAYSPAGQTDFQRDQSAFNVLMASNDPKNIAQAASMFGKMFPGVSFDAESLIEQVGQEKFARSMEQMATLSNTFKTWDESAVAADKLGLIKTLGEQAAKEMFSGLKVNAIDEQWNAIEESVQYQALPDEQKKDIAAFFIASLTGELSFDIQPEFTVKNKDGVVVKKFDNQEDADAHISGKTGYTVIPTNKYVMKSITGAQTVVNVGGGSDNDPPGGEGNPMVIEPSDGRLDGLSYTSYNSAGEPVKSSLADGQTFTVNSNLTTGLGMVVKAGTYTVVEGEDGSKWFKNKSDGKYYLATSGNNAVNGILMGDSSAKSKLQTGLDKVPNDLHEFFSIAKPDGTYSNVQNILNEQGSLGNADITLSDGTTRKMKVGDTVSFDYITGGGIGGGTFVVSGDLNNIESTVLTSKDPVVDRITGITYPIGTKFKIDRGEVDFVVPERGPYNNGTMVPAKTIYKAKLTAIS